MDSHQVDELYESFRDGDKYYESSETNIENEVDKEASGE